METVIKRDQYLNQLIRRKHNHLVKVVTGIRRCGKSFLLNTLFKEHLLSQGVARDHIIEMSFDLFRNKAFRDPNEFFPWVTQQLVDDDMYYILLDEVQLLGEFVSVLNDFAARGNCDVYVTGSNAKFLSKDIATEFGGRSIETRVHPLSFSEYMSVYPGNEIQGLNDFLRYGSLPLIALKDTEEEKRQFLKDLLKETYLRDLIARNKIKNTSEMSTLLSVLASSLGGLTNPTKLENTFRTKEHSKITATTIANYLSYLEDAFLINETKRYDIMGRAYIGTPMKYYFADLGLANAQLDFRQYEVSRALENAVYNELLIRGFSVDIGNVPFVAPNATGTLSRKFTEIDFVCNKDSRRYYVQVAYDIDTAEKRAQEIRPFLKIRDVHRKILITYTALETFYTEEGILVMSIFDFLRDPNSLDVSVA